MAGLIWRTKCSHCGEPIDITSDTPSRDEADGATSYIARCGECDEKATYRRGPALAVTRVSIPEEADQVPARRKWLAVTVPLVAAMALGLTCGLAGFTAGVGGGFAMGYAAQPETPKKVKPAVTYTRAQFDDLVDGKTPDEVIAAVGKPDTTNDTGRWTYYGITYDPAAKLMDSAVEIQFNNNAIKRTCSQVRFR